MRYFTSAFFQKTCKILRVRKVRTSAYHAKNNWMLERFHSHPWFYFTLHWLHRYELGCRVTIFFVAYRVTTHSTAKYSPFYLIHGREIVVPNERKLKAKIAPDVQDADQVQGLENWKSNLIKAYKQVRLNNRRAQQKKQIIIRNLRRGNLRLKIKFICSALLGSQGGVLSLGRSGKDLSSLCKGRQFCIIKSQTRKERNMRFILNV